MLREFPADDWLEVSVFLWSVMLAEATIAYSIVGEYYYRVSLSADQRCGAVPAMQGSLPALFVCAAENNGISVLQRERSHRASLTQLEGHGVRGTGITAGLNQTA